MYINAVLVGVLGTLFVEMALVLGVAVVCAITKGAGKKHKGGSKNG